MRPHPRSRGSWGEGACPRANDPTEKGKEQPGAQPPSIQFGTQGVCRCLACRPWPGISSGHAIRPDRDQPTQAFEKACSAQAHPGWDSSELWDSPPCPPLGGTNECQRTQLTVLSTARYRVAPQIIGGPSERACWLVHQHHPSAAGRPQSRATTRAALFRVGQSRPHREAIAGWQS